MKYMVVSSFVCSCLTGSCNLMDTESQEHLSGDEMWDEASVQTVESFVNSMYVQFRAATMQDACFILYSGDLRCAPVQSSSSTYFVQDLMDNDLNALREHYTGDDNVQSERIMQWKGFYKVIQSANILLKELDRTNVSANEAETYRDEAVFMRCLAYFFLVRNFSDVPYYTDAYHQEPLPRTNMVAVLKNIAGDLNQILLDDPDVSCLPWTHASSNKKAIRASRGAVLALLMHVNMWLAGFDEEHKNAYYEAVAESGKQLVEQSGSAYALLPLNQSSTIFRGGSNEGIFEIVQNLSFVNGNEMFHEKAIFSNLVMYSHLSSGRTSQIQYTYDFLTKIYPPDEQDGRVSQCTLAFYNT